MKQMHRLIMTSTAYRQSSRRTAAQDAVDAGNALYGRYPLRRLDAEALRDRMLAAAGQLDRTLFRPPVPMTEDAVGQGVVPDDRPRRSLYLQARRTRPVAFLAAFDAPTGELNCERRLYGLDQEQTREYGTRCLIARRLVERGVRFVQLFLGGQPWDTHNDIRRTLPDICRRTDRPAAALVTDLKQRGLLDTTLVHWGGEIGRLPVCEGELNDAVGRDHNGQGFSVWLAGGGVKGGMTYGEADEVGHRAAVNVVSPNDYQAAVLHLLGFDHARLAYHQNGREQRLTDGRPVRMVREVLG